MMMIMCCAVVKRGELIINYNSSSFSSPFLHLHPFSVELRALLMMMMLRWPLWIWGTESLSDINVQSVHPTFVLPLFLSHTTCKTEEFSKRRARTTIIESPSFCIHYIPFFLELLNWLTDSIRLENKSSSLHQFLYTHFISQVSFH